MRVVVCRSTCKATVIDGYDIGYGIYVPTLPLVEILKDSAAIPVVSIGCPFSEPKEYYNTHTLLYTFTHIIIHTTISLFYLVFRVQVEGMSLLHLTIIVKMSLQPVYIFTSMFG